MNRRTFVKTITAGTLALLCGCRVRNRFNILIKNGTVIDGTGSEAFQGDIGVIGDKIAAIGNLKSTTADTVIDGKGLVISPGFIDIHSHTDLELLVNPKAESKIHQGVTTELSGNCGYSPFPLNDSDFLQEDADAFAKYGFHINWNDVNNFLLILQNHKISINYATLTGHGNLRSYVVGKNDVQATPQQLKLMMDLLRQSIENGSFGLSTGLEYAPGSYASTSELIELNKVVAQLNGIYATHMRDEEDFVEEAIEEALTICRESGVSMQISHLKANHPHNWHKLDHMLEMIHSASASGLPILADRYPYIAFGTGLSAFLPLWARQGNEAEIISRLNDKHLIPQIDKHLETQGKNMGGWERVVITYCSLKDNKQLVGKSIAHCANEKNLSATDFIRSILTREKNRVRIVGFGMSEDNLRKVLSSPLIMIASDGNAISPQGILAEGQPHPRYYGTFPRVLGKYCREEQLFDLPTAVKKMTSMPAQKMGIPKRGILAKDYYADIVLFNSDTVIDRATFENPHQFPVGIDYVIVNGKITVSQGEHTSARAGAILRHSVS
ncbi:D-aminoacylase [candidate division KSB1 bacterium]|nr:D-aminoacylase [candidate division KSB1 bacterium]